MVSRGELVAGLHLVDKAHNDTLRCTLDFSSLFAKHVQAFSKKQPDFFQCVLKETHNTNTGFKEAVLCKINF